VLSINSPKVRTILIAFAMLLVLLGIIWTQQRRLMYFPFGQVPDLTETGLRRAAAVTLQTEDGLTLHGWFARPAITPRYTVIVFNGNAGNRTHRVRLAREFTERGLSVLLFDYRGFGRNAGSPTEAGLRTDARAARDHVVRRSDVDSTRLVYFGESLGAAVAAELATDHPPAALILRSPFTSATDVARVHYGFLPVQWLLRDRFATIDLINRVRTPLLVIAGDRDSIVPAEQSRRLFEAAGEPKSLTIVAGADHNDDSLQGGRHLVDVTLQFLDANVN
jgi:uncharacterized protein